MNNIHKTKNSLRIRKYDIINEGTDEEYIQKTPEWEQFVEEQKILNQLKKNKIPSHVYNLSFDSLINYEDKIEKLRKYVVDFDKKFNSVHLFFWSELNGTQKTTAAAILAKELLLKQFKVKFTLMSDLSKLLTKEGFDENADKEIEDYLNCDFLVIDDSFDKKKMTIYKSGYQIPFLDTFLRKRLEQYRKATCFTSNVKIQDIDFELFGISLVKLIKRSIIDPWHFDVSYSVRNDFNPEDLWS